MERHSRLFKAVQQLKGKACMGAGYRIAQASGKTAASSFGSSGVVKGKKERQKSN